MRLIDADKLFPDRNTEKGLAISQSQIANAETIESQRWIPCNERLPEEDGEYFVSVRYKYVKGYESVCTEYGEWNDGSWIYNPEYCGEAEGIIAWMPLPEPYRESEDKE